MANLPNDNLCDHYNRLVMMESLNNLIIQLKTFVYGSWHTLQSNNFKYKKQMVLFNDKSFTLLFECVIIMNKQAHINIHSHRNSCVPLNNNTTNIGILESTYRCTYKSTKEPSRYNTYATINSANISHLIVQTVSPLQPLSISIFTSCSTLRIIINNGTNNTFFGVHYGINKLKINDNTFKSDSTGSSYHILYT